jgi:hypothetical protein
MRVTPVFWTVRLHVTMICRILLSLESLVSSIGIAASYVLNVQFSVIGRGKIPLFFIASRSALGPMQPPLQWVPGAIPAGS